MTGPPRPAGSCSGCSWSSRSISTSAAGRHGPRPTSPATGSSGSRPATRCGPRSASDSSATPLERFVLIDDTWASYLSGRLGLAAVAELVAALAADETDLSVWRRLGGVCSDVVRLGGDAHLESTRRFAARLGTAALALTETRLDLAGPSAPSLAARDLELRAVQFTLAGVDGADPITTRRARGLLEDPTVDAELRSAAVSVVAAGATPEEHSWLMQRWKDADTPQDELRYLNSLVDTDDPTLFDQTLDLAVTDVRTQNAPYLLRRAIAHRSLGGQAWRMVEDRWDQLVERFPSNSLPRMLEGVRWLTDPETAARAEAFIAEHPTPSGERQVAQHLERMWVTVAAARRTVDQLAADPNLLDDAGG